MLKKIVLFVLLSFSSLGFATPLHDAVRSGNLEEVIRRLVKGANVNAPDELGNTSLHLACAMWNIALDELFIAMGRMPLGHQPYLKNIAIVRVLLEAGANVYATNFAGNTPLHLASNQECIDLLNNHIEWLENRGRRTKGALRESSTETSEGASSPTALCHLQQNQQSVVDEPEDDEEAEEPNHVPTTVVEATTVAVEVTQTQAVTCTTTTPMATMPPGSLAIDFDALLDSQF